MLDHSCTCRSHRRRRRKTPLVETLVGIVTLLLALVARADGDTEHSILELEMKTCSESLGWVGGRNHCHLCSSADTADGTEEEEAKTSAAWPLE